MRRFIPVLHGFYAISRLIPIAMTVALSTSKLAELAATIKTWGRELGFQQVGIADLDLGEPEARLFDWLAAGFHAEMEYMARHGVKRSRPAELVPARFG